jgi:competence protein ComEA
MLKKLLAIALMMGASLSFAAVDVNKASAADLDSIKGIGPAVSTKILEERKKGNFKDWNDLIDRVKGVGQANAVKFSEAGLTVGGVAFKPSAAPAPAADKDSKAAKPVAKAAASAAK